MRSDFVKFIRKTICFLLPVLIIIGIAEILISQSVFSHYSTIFSKVTSYQKKADEVKILVFGSSHANNAISDSFSSHIFNIANPGQDFASDLFLLNFLGDLPEVETVVFTASYFSFDYDEAKEWPFRVRDYLDLQTLKPEKNLFRFRDWLYDRSKLLNYNLSPFQILKYYLKKNTNMEILSTPGRQPKETTIESCETILRKDAERRALPVQARYHNAPPHDIEKIFKKMLDICRKRNKKVFLVAPPFSKVYNLGVGEKCKRDFDLKLIHFGTKYNIPVLDYSRDPRFENDCTLFQNADHLNPKGAMKFTKIVLEDIGKNG